MSTQELMDHLDVSRRTLFRDLKMLELAGIPYHYEKGMGYRIGSHFFLKPMNLTVPETLGLMLLAKTTPARRSAPLGKDAVAAIAKLTATVPQNIHQACQDLLSRVTVDHGAQLGDGRESANYVLLQQCIDEERCCQVTYQGAGRSDPLTMRLSAYAMHFASRAWYVLGHCDVFDEVRILKLNRIIRIDLLDQMFIRPANFNPMDKIGQAWSLIPEGKIYTIKLEFSARVAGNVMETRWHASQKHEMLSDGRCVLTFTVDGLNEIAWWICGYADQVKVLEPVELKHRIHQMLVKACEQYLPETQASGE